MLQKGHIDDAIIFSDTDTLTEIADCLGRIAPSPHTCEGGHSWVVPAAHSLFFYQLNKPPFTYDCVTEVETGELDLLRMAFNFQFIHKPIIEGPVVFEL